MKKIKSIFKDITADKLFKYVKDFIYKNPIFVFFVLSNFINSIFLRLFSTGNLDFLPFVFDLGLVLFVGSISFLLKKKNRNIYYIIMTIILVLICIINSIYYNYYSSFVSVSLIATSVFIKDVGDTVIDFAISLSDGIYLWAIVGIILMIRKKVDTNNNIKKKFLGCFITSIAFIIFGCMFTTGASWSRFVKLWNRVLVVDAFGVYTYQIDDIIQSLKPTLNNMFGYDDALAETKEYYENKNTNGESNKYTKIFEGKNVIAIHAESLQNFLINTKINGIEITPNLNKIVNEGLYFNNFYAQVGVGTSSDSEFTYATSLLPAQSGTAFINYYDNKFVSLQSLLNDKGYYVFSMHGNVGSFWNRDVMHPNLGYDKFYSKSSFIIDESYGLGLSDVSFFNQSVSMIKEINDNLGEPFYGTLITLTNHTPWDDVDLYSDMDLTMKVNVDGVDVVRDYLDNRTLGKYIKSVNYMDSAIGLFFNQMEENGLLDNTVIVIYGDHDARISKKQYNYYYNYDPYTDRVLTENDEGYVEFNDYDYELSKNVPLIIWSNDLEKSKVIDTPMGMIDVMPTLGNMLGVYNKYALGRDIMSITKDEGIVMYKDGSYITNKIYYSSKNNEVYALSNGVISDEYLDGCSDYVEQIIGVSNNVITYDLIKELE